MTKSIINETKAMIPVSGGTIAAYAIGKGPPVIFLHGGPGDTHGYMKRMAEPLFDKFQCIFFDQRGTGGSNNLARTESEYTIELLIEDLHAVAKHFGVAKPALVGHSWGAMYALFACIRDPGAFRKAALLSMGPLDADMRLRTKAWVFDPALRAEFLEDYFLDPAPDREVNKWIWTHAEPWFKWSDLKNVTLPIWICSGANDSVPLEQSERIAVLTPNTGVSIIENCGHLPWLERPKMFYSALRNFLA